MNAGVSKSTPDENVLDPVAAYDRLAPYYSEFSNRRSAYLESVESNIVSRVPLCTASLLDFGAGNGIRAQQIATATGVSEVVLVEPSSRMSDTVPSGIELWPIRVEDLRLGEISKRFDVITCLWNVLGHVQGSAGRIRALTNAAQLLSPVGLLFVDVIHRYNVRSYGVLATSWRWLRDHIAPGETNGEVVARWETDAGTISTYGHVFTDREMRHLAESAGLECVERVVIDYETGVTHRSSCMGNLLYVLRCSSRSDSSNAPQTS